MPMEDTRRAFLLGLAGAARRAKLAALERVMGPMPRIAGGTRWKADGEWTGKDYRRLHILFESEPGDSVPAWLLIPARPHPKRPAALCLHQTVRIGKNEPAGLGGSPNLHYAKELAQRGWVALAPDYPNFGEYRFDAYAHGYVSATMKGVVNHARAVRLLQALPGVDRRRIAAVGHSLGGHNALFLAAFDLRVAAVVSSCGFTSFRRYMGGDLRGWSHAGYMPRIASEFACDPARMPFDFTDVFELIAPRAVFVNAPLGDDNFGRGGRAGNARPRRRAVPAGAAGSGVS